MMEAASTSETSINFYHTTQHCNPEDSHLHGNASLGSTKVRGFLDRLNDYQLIRIILLHGDS
jgi:hypothetical protein